MSEFKNQLVAPTKSYVDLEGLKTLINRIGALRAEYTKRFDEETGDVSGLLDRIDSLLNGADGADAAKSLEALQEESNNDTGIVKEIAEKLTILEDGLNGLDGSAITQVSCSGKEEIAGSNKITISFLNGHDEERGTIEIDTTDFIVDGMLGDVKLISVVENGTKIVDTSDGKEYTAASDEPYKTLVTESDGKTDGERYFVFSFKTTIGEADQNIWVPVKDLHDNYDFKAGAATDYVTFAKGEQHKANGATEVTYTVGLTQKAIDAIKLANGDYLKDGKYKVHGVEELSDAVGDLQTAIDIDGANDPVEDSNRNAIEIIRDDITALETAETATQDWVLKNTVDVKSIEDYFDYVVFGDEGADATRGDALADIYTKFNIETGNNIWQGDVPTLKVKDPD